MRPLMDMVVIDDNTLMTKLDWQGQGPGLMKTWRTWQTWGMAKWPILWSFGTCWGHGPLKMALGLGKDVVPTYIVHEDLEKESKNDKVKDQARLSKQEKSSMVTWFGWYGKWQGNGNGQVPKVTRKAMMAWLDRASKHDMMKSKQDIGWINNKGTRQWHEGWGLEEGHWQRFNMASKHNEWRTR